MAGEQIRREGWWMAQSTQEAQEQRHQAHSAEEILENIRTMEPVLRLMGMFRLRCWTERDKALIELGFGLGGGYGEQNAWQYMLPVMNRIKRPESSEEPQGQPTEQFQDSAAANF